MFKGGRGMDNECNRKEVKHNLLNWKTSERIDFINAFDYQNKTHSNNNKIEINSIESCRDLSLSHILSDGLLEVTIH